MNKRIMVTVGPSSISREVVEFADSLALKNNAELFVLHVQERSPYVVETGEVFKKFMETITLKTPSHEILSPVGYPSQQIVDEANRYNVDLIVMAAHSHTLIGELLLGGITKYVMHHCKCPVFVYKKPEQAFENKIVVPIDFTEVNRKVVAIADDYAMDFGGDLAFVHVDPDEGYYGAWTAHSYGVVVPEESMYKKPDLEAVTAKLKEYLDGLQIKSKYEYKVFSGSANAKILEYQEQLDAKLIMLASHSHTALGRLLIGGTTDKLLNKGGCSLYVYKE